MKTQIKKIKELKEKAELALSADLQRPIEQRDGEFFEYFSGQIDAYNKVLLLLDMKFEDNALNFNGTRFKND